MICQNYDMKSNKWIHHEENYYGFQDLIQIDLRSLLREFGSEQYYAHWAADIYSKAIKLIHNGGPRKF